MKLLFIATFEPFMHQAACRVTPAGYDPVKMSGTMGYLMPIADTRLR